MHFYAMEKYTKRWMASVLQKVLSFQRTAVVIGARQSGKSTLVRHEMPVESVYVTLDDEDNFNDAKNDVRFFLRQGKDKCLVIDEIQKVPRLISEIKMRVDMDNRPAQFVMTGSADYRKLPQSTDSLAGRTVFVRLRTMAEAEARGKQPLFLENAFKHEFPSISQLEPCSKEALFNLAIAGGYPQARTLSQEERFFFFNSYAQAQISHDLAENWDLKRFGALDTLLHYTAAYSSKLENILDISKKIPAARPTVTDYLKALEAMFLVDRVPAWHHKDYDIGSRKPKLFMTDTGLMAYLLRVPSAKKLLSDRILMADTGGKLAETWVYNQLASEMDTHAGWKISHLRYNNKQEIDFMIESMEGDLMGIEVKSAETLNTEDAKNLRWFKQKSRHPFTGLIIYAGNNLMSFGDGIYGVPYSAFWAT